MTQGTPRDSAQLPPLTDTEVARVFRQVYGGTRYDATQRMFAAEIAHFRDAQWNEALRAQAASVPVGEVYSISMGRGEDAYACVRILNSAGITGYWDLPIREGGKLYAGAPPAHIPADVEAPKPVAWYRHGWKNAEGAVVSKGSRGAYPAKVFEVNPHVVGWGLFEWHPVVDAPQPQAVAASSPATAVDAVFEEAFQLVFEAYAAPGDRFNSYEAHLFWVNSKITKAFTLMQKYRAALQASRQPQAQQGVAEGAGEVVAWAVWWGIGQMRPLKTLFDTEDEAERNALCIKSYTEVRPVYATKEQRS